MLSVTWQCSSCNLLKYKPLRYRVICCTAVWITGLVSCVLYTVVHMMLLYGFHFCSLSFPLHPLFCLVAVLRALKQSGPGERGREREEEKHMKRESVLYYCNNEMTTLVIFGPLSSQDYSIFLTQGDTSVCHVLACTVLCWVVLYLPLLYLRRKGKLALLQTSLTPFTLILNWNLSGINRGDRLWKISVNFVTNICQLMFKHLVVSSKLNSIWSYFAI